MNAGILNDIFYSHLPEFPGIPGLFHIAPVATYLTSPQPNEVSSLTLVISFTLNGIKGFHKRKCFHICRFVEDQL
jgi:hypothetical protein